MTALNQPERLTLALDRFYHGINRIAISSSERFIATSDVDMNVTVRDRGQVVFERNFGSDNDKIRPTERVRGLEFSTSEDVMLVAAGSQIHAFHTDRWGTAWSYEAPRSFGFLIISPIAIDTALNGESVAAFDNGSIVVWDRHGEKLVRIHDNDSPKWLRAVGAGEEIVGSDGVSLCRWRRENHKRKQKIRLTGRVFGMDVDKKRLVAATRTLQDISLWDLESEKHLNTIPVGPGIPVLALHPSEPWLAFAEQGRVRVVDYSGNEVTQFDLDVASALCMRFTQSGSDLVIGCTEQHLIRRSVVGAV